MADAGIYEQHIQPLESRLIASAWRVLGNEEDARDALHDALTRIWHNRDQLTKHPNPTAWMLRITLNAAYDLLRKRKPWQPLPPEHPGQSGSPEAPIQHAETRQRLLAEIAQLSPQQAQAVLLRLVEAMPYREVAAALGCSEQTARVYVHNGRDRLRRRLSDLNPYTLRSLS